MEVEGTSSAGLAQSVPHEVRRKLLHRSLATVQERDLAAVNTVITESTDDAVEAIGLGMAA